MPRQVLRRRFADMPDSEREDEAGERRVLAPVDRGDARWRPTSPPSVPAPASVGGPSRRRRPACARGRRRPAGRRACRPGPRCPSRGGRRNAAVPACAARGRRGRRCSARSASSGSRTTAEPHSGHSPASRTPARRAGAFRATTRTTSGITSPARRTMTVSPMRTSLRRTSSSLCSVALVTVTPPTKTGFSRATGVIAPVRPTCTSMPITSVAISSAGNLCATAQRGSRRHEAQLALQIEPVDLVDDAVDLERQLRASPRRRVVEFGERLPARAHGVGHD